MAMTNFGVGIFLLVESGSRVTAARSSWTYYKEDQQATIEATRRCCGWEDVAESPQCRWKTNGPCGASIITKQRETMVGLGATYASLAAAQLLLFGVTSWLISSIRKRQREMKALEEAKYQRRSSKASTKDLKDPHSPLGTANLGNSFNK